jgi:hypothetical protein
VDFRFRGNDRQRLTSKLLAELRERRYKFAGIRLTDQ